MLIKKKLSKVVKQFCLETSIHGLPHIARGLKEFFWITATFLATLLCVWQSVLNVGEYLTYHVQTKSTTDVLNSIEFPAITICSQYNIKRSTLSRVPLSSLFLATANANDDRNIQKLIKQVIFFFFKNCFMQINATCNCRTRLVVKRMKMLKQST